MTAEENKALARRSWEVTMQDLDHIEEVYAPNVVWHQADQDIVGLEAAKQLAAMFLSAFPDLHATVEDVLAEGDKVVTRVMVRGTHRGELMGMAPTQRQIELKGITIHRIEGDKIVEEWELSDTQGVLQQLGMAVIPGPRLLVRTLVHQAKKLRSRLAAGRSG